jgi:hypothetical protein
MARQACGVGLARFGAIGVGSAEWLRSHVAEGGAECGVHSAPISSSL